MYETVASRFKAALIGARLNVLHVEYVTTEYAPPIIPLVSFVPFLAGQLRIQWLVPPAVRDTNMVERISEHFDWEGIAALDTGVSGEQLLKMLRAMPEATIQSLLLKLLARALAADKGFAQECGIHL
jgi:hypothetical protein